MQLDEEVDDRKKHLGKEHYQRPGVDELLAGFAALDDEDGQEEDVQEDDGEADEPEAEGHP